MHLLKSLLIGFILIFLAMACSTSTTYPPLEDNTFHKENTSTTPIHTLNTTGDLLLAGTDQGAFKKVLDTNNKDWQQAGLQIDSSKVVDFVFLSDQEILAGIQYDNVRTTKPTLYKSNDKGGSWSAMEIEKPNKLEYFVIQHLEKQKNDEKKLFAYVGRVVSSKDNGNSWEISKKGLSSSGFSEFLVVSEYHPQKIWTGGVMPIFSPYLSKSNNGSETWSNLNDEVFFNSDATLYDVIVHPENPKQVLVGSGGAVSPANIIRKSTDGGKNWQTVFEGINTRTLTHSTHQPEVVYASGRNAEGTLFFAASNDFGNTWETVEMTDSPSDIQVNDMVSIMVEGKEILYLGTNKGIYSYRFKE